MHENHDQGKVSKPRLLMIYVGRIARQEQLDISEDYMKNHTFV